MPDDNLTDEQRERLGRELYDVALARSGEGYGPQWTGLTEAERMNFREDATRLYLAGRDDERAKWKARVEETEQQWAAQVILDKGHATDWKLARRALCEAFPDCFDATGGEHG